MSGRGYLSIGDVLTLLREEFPDVTISKIRFLESQGLVEPERSASGYRKFYERDVERLRWVLRQQREHFLPLKVIRDRLGGDQNGSGDTPATVVASDGETMAPTATVRTSDHGADVPVGRDGKVEVPPPHNGHRAPAVVDDGPSRGAVAPGGPAAEAVAHRPAGVDGGTRTEVGSRDVESREHVMAEGTPQSGPQDREIGADGAALGESAGSPPAGPSATTMTAEELCAASGISQADLEGLERFGLLARVTVAGITCYDQDALAVARIAAGFARFGVEPRHLRLFRNACDRELGLLEQIITPLLRQRNPEARQRATAAANELGRLGDGLHNVLRRQGIRSHLE